MPDSEDIIIATFYKFVPLGDYRDLRQPLLYLCTDNDIRGTILLAGEGINATVAGTRRGIDTLMGQLYKDHRFCGMEYKESLTDVSPFYRMKVKLRREIVSLGSPGTDPSYRSGIRVPADQWNALTSEPDVLVIDVRNKYECDIGSFRDAVLPGTGSFSEFPEYVKQNLSPQKHKKIAMYCTGGIRCEKASAYMLQQGFEQVYQLSGGILRYLEKIQTENSLWQGECFVFDGRVAVDQALHKGQYDQCYSCRNPVSADDKKSAKYEEGISCPSCYDTLTAERRASLKERQRQVKLAEQRNQQHIGVPQTGHIDPIG